MLRSDVAQLDCDFLAGCGRKALRATEGSGFLYVRRALIGQVEPMLVGWWNGAYDRSTGALSLNTRQRHSPTSSPIRRASCASRARSTLW